MRFVCAELFGGSRSHAACNMNAPPSAAMTSPVLNDCTSDRENSVASRRAIHATNKYGTERQSSSA